MSCNAATGWIWRPSPRSSRSTPTRSRTPLATSTDRAAWRRPVAVAGVLLGAALVAAGLAIPALIGARAELSEGRAAAEAGREALAEGAVHEAQGHFTVAEDAFGRGADRLRSRLAQPARLVPVVSRNLRAAHAVAASGRDAAEGATVTTGALLGLPGGPGDLAPRGGRVPVELLEPLMAPLERASALFADARDRIDAAPRALLVREVAEARRELAEALHDAADASAMAAHLTAALPGFLGAEDDRRYFFGAQNPAELRGTGGLIGVYAIVEMRRGRISLTEFNRTEVLDDLAVTDVPAPNVDYAARYDRFGGAAFWKNLNMTPDVPSAATAITSLYAATTGEQLDGVILADPALLAGLLEVTGPIEVEPFGTVEAGEVVDLVTNRAYAALTSNTERTAVLGTIAHATMDRFLRGGLGDPAAAVTALADAAGGGHLVLHSAHEKEQDAFVDTGIAGELPASGAGYLGVFTNNVGANKLDYFAQRTVDYTVELLPQGRARGRLALTLANDAVLRGQPDYVTGVTGELPPGEYEQILSVFCGPCELVGFQRGGEDATAVVETELGHQVYSAVVRLGPGEQETLEYTFELQAAWSPRDKRFQLVVQDQPTIVPTELRMQVVPPEDRGAPATLEVRGPDRLTRMDVELTAPWHRRAWWGVRDVLARPVIRIGGG